MFGLFVVQRRRCGFWFGSVVSWQWRFVILIWIDYGPAMEVCDFGLDQQWVGEGLWILVWIGEVGLLWFEQRFCGLAMV